MAETTEKNEPNSDPRLAADYKPEVAVKTIVVPAPPKPDQHYWCNASSVDQGLLGPDDRSRVVPPKAYVHGSQARVPGLLTRATGTFVKVRNTGRLEELQKQRRGQITIIGGPLNNVKGAFVPRI